MAKMQGQNRLDNIAKRGAETAIHNPRYSKFIRWARLILPIIAAIILTVVFTWSNLTNDMIVPVAGGELSIESIGKNELINPRFESRDAEGKPYTITAKRALQAEGTNDMIVLEDPFGEMTINQEQKIAIHADNGAYQQDIQRLLLKDNVKIAHSQGTTLDTAELHIDLKQNQAWTDQDVTAQNQDGTITAKGLRANQIDETLKFIGPAKLVLTNGKIDTVFSAPSKNTEQP